MVADVLPKAKEKKTREEIMLSLEDKTVSELFNRLESQINRLAPNGATNHKQDKNRILVRYFSRTYEEENISFQQIAERNIFEYDVLVKTICAAVNDHDLSLYN